nr:hypothetical protein CFP56_58332 [Quercus suber]
MRSPKNLNRKFEKCLKQKLTCGNKKVNGFVVGIFAGDGEVPALYGLPILRRLLKLSIESFSFFLSPFTTEVLVRSEDKPGPQRLEIDFDQLVFLRARDTSASMQDRRSFTALALWRERVLR